MRLRSAAPLLLAAALAGCMHRVRVQSDPPGAMIRVGREVVGPAPQDVRFLWWPFRPLKVRVAAQGDRPVVIQVNQNVGPMRFLGELLTFRYKRLLGLTPRATVEVILVREHGASGTWLPEDIRR